MTSPRPQNGARLRALLVALGVTALPFTAAADGIYSYTDADGVVHFTSKPTAGSKLYIKSEPKSFAPGVVRPGVVPFAPQDRDVGRYSRYDEHIRQAASL